MASNFSGRKMEFIFGIEDCMHMLVCMGVPSVLIVMRSRIFMRVMRMFVELFILVNT